MKNIIERFLVNFAVRDPQCEGVVCSFLGRYKICKLIEGRGKLQTDTESTGLGNS